MLVLFNNFMKKSFTALVDNKVTVFGSVCFKATVLHFKVLPVFDEKQ